METLSIDTVWHDYWVLPTWVRRHGQKRSPRGKLTHDIGPVTIIVRDPRCGLAVQCGRRLNPRIAAVEAVQLIGGFADPNLPVWASEHFREFREPTGEFHGAYGNRIGQQLTDVITKLHIDPDTRQAVITLWNPHRDNIPGKLDYPCTVALNFALVRGGLELRTLMRSNDVWLGTPYDLFQFTQLQLTVASLLNVPVGPYTHTTWSLHLYEEHAELVDGLHAPEGIAPYEPSGLAVLGDGITRMKDRCYQLVYGDDMNVSQLSSPSIRWYRDRLKPYHTFLNGGADRDDEVK